MKIDQAAKTYDEAVALALSELGAERDEIEIEVLDPGSKGFFGIGTKPCRIRVTRIVDPVSTARSFMREIAAAMNVAAEVMIDQNGNHLNVTLTGKDMGIFIGKRGQTLDSLQYLLSLVVNKEKGERQYLSVTLDTENYRSRRKETLEALARNLAKKALKTHKSVVLEPMSANERRIIHAALQFDKFVTTHSEGEEPHRNIVITLKKLDGERTAPRKPRVERPKIASDPEIVTVHKAPEKKRPEQAPVSATSPDTSIAAKRKPYDRRRRPKTYTGYKKPEPSWKRFPKDASDSVDDISRGAIEFND